jgi:thioredoxin 1
MRAYLLAAVMYAVLATYVSAQATDEDTDDGVAPMAVLRNATALAAARAQANFTAVLFTSSGWTWCAACQSLRNSTDAIRRHIISTLRKENPHYRTDPRTGKKISLKERHRILLRRSTPVNFVLFDCSDTAPNTPGHPCTTEAAGWYPTLVLHSHQSGEQFAFPSTAATSKEVTFTDPLAVYRFLVQHVPSLKSIETPKLTNTGDIASDDDEATATTTPRVNRVPFQQRSSRLVRYGKENLTRVETYVLAILHPQQCLQCRDDFVAIEGVAEAIGDSARDELNFARIALDASVRDVLQLQDDGPVIALLLPKTGKFAALRRPIVYTGPRDIAQMISFLHFHTRLSLPSPHGKWWQPTARSKDAVADYFRGLAAAPGTPLRSVAADDIEALLFAPPATQDPMHAAAKASRGSDRKDESSGSSIDGIRLALFAAEWTSPLSHITAVSNAFATAAITFARAETGIQVSWLIINLNNLNTSAAVSDYDRIPATHMPFVAWCRAPDCATSEKLNVVGYDLTALNLLAFIGNVVAQEVAAAHPAMPKTAAALAEFTAPTQLASAAAAQELVRVRDGGVDRLSTLEPLASTSEHDSLANKSLRAAASGHSGGRVGDDEFDDDEEPTLVLPSSYYEDLQSCFVLVTFHGTDGARRESQRAVSRLQAAAGRMAVERKVASEYRRRTTFTGAGGVASPNASLATIDGNRFSGLAKVWLQSATVAVSEPLEQAFLVHLRRDTKAGAALGSWDASVITFASRNGNEKTTMIPDDPFAKELTNVLEEEMGGPPSFDLNVVDVTPNTFVEKVLDETKGVLLLIMGRDCPHSLSVLPNFADATVGFKADMYQLSFATLEVERLTAENKVAMGITHFPQLRWYAKGPTKSLGGEVVDLTPYKDAIIEFVSEEMGFANMDLQQAADAEDVFSQLNTKDFSDKVVAARDSSIVLYVYSGRSMSERRLTVLRRMAWHFTNFTEDPQSELFPPVPKVAVPSKPASPLKEDDDDDFDDDEEEATTRENASPSKSIVPPSHDDETTAVKNAVRRIRFYRIDALRYRKALIKHGFGALAERTRLPTLVLLPEGINKEHHLTYYPTEATFSELSITKWILRQTKLESTLEMAFNFTDEEYANDRDPPLVNVQELDQANFFDFMGDGGDAVVLYYAQWCRHSQIYMKAFAKAAEHFAAAGGHVKFGRVDVPNNAHVGHHQGIQAFPTVMVYFKGSNDREGSYGETFRGEKTAAALISYVEGIRGTSKVQVVDDARSQRRALVQRLDAATFRQIIEQPRNHSVLLEFSTTWCGHCRHTDDLLADLVDFHTGLGRKFITAKIDAELQSDIATTYNATANFPVILFFPPLREAPVRSGAKLKNVHYKDGRFFADIQEFLATQDPTLAATDTQRRAFEDKRNREDAFAVEKLTKKLPDSPPPSKSTGTGSTPAGGIRAHKRTMRPSSDRATGPDGEEMAPPGSDGVFLGFPEEVRNLNSNNFGSAIEGANVALVLHYATPGDEAIMSAYAALSATMKPALKKRIFSANAIEAGDFPALTPFIGKAPTLTLFRGLATPAMVKFSEFPDAPLGDGGSLTNVTHLLAFVDKHLRGSKVSSVELTDKTYNRAVNNMTLGVAVFFYAPYCQECREPAQAFDEVAQMLGHREDIVLTRVDISRTIGPYRLLGQRPLPFLVMYDVPSDPRAAAAPGAERRPRLFEGRHMTRETIGAFVQWREEDEIAAKRRRQEQMENGDDSDVFNADDVNEEPGQQKSRHQTALEERELRRKLDVSATAKPLLPLMIPTEEHLNITLRDFPGGVLIFFTARWCPHCRSALRDYSALVPALQDTMVVAGFDVTAAPTVLARHDVVSVPSIVHVSEKWGKVVFTGPKRTTQALLKFAMRLAPKRPDADLPLYDEWPAQDSADGDDDEANKAAEEAKRFPAVILDTETAVRRAIATSAAPNRSDARSSFAAAVIFITSPTCGGTRCGTVNAAADRVASALRHTRSVIGVYNASFGGRLFDELQVTTVPSVHIHCGKFNVTRAVSALSAPQRITRNGRVHIKTNADELLIERIATLVDDHCLPRSKAIDDLSKTRRSLSGEEVKEDKTLDLRELVAQRTKESALVLLRPQHCESTTCATYDKVWEGVRKEASKRHPGAAGLIDYVRVEMGEAANKPLRRVLFQRRMQQPSFVYMLMDPDAKRAPKTAAVDDAVDVVNGFRPFSGALTVESVLEFIALRHRSERT